ncbi:MAG: hypothetical protein IKA31_03830 [Clostridia bacterium]|nr:hypothetical protein [Clostridia bacterium]
MEKKSKNKELKIETIGAPKFSVLSKEDFNSLISCLEFQIREFYKEKREKENENKNTDKKG